MMMIAAVQKTRKTATTTVKKVKKDVTIYQRSLLAYMFAKVILRKVKFRVIVRG